MPEGDVSIYALSPTSYPKDYYDDNYTLVAKDAYGTEVSARFIVKKFMNFNDGIWFRLSYYVRGSNGERVWKGKNYKFESGKDIYLTLPKDAYNYVDIDCCPYEYGNSVYVSRAEIVDFENGSVGTRTKNLHSERQLPQLVNSMRALLSMMITETRRLFTLKINNI